jgi:tRNA pseudouridine32 synthase/23S rRNA pseudouridine746 synthase
MHALGIPIPPVHPTPDDDYAHPLQLLAKSLRFKDPLTGEERAFHTCLSLLPG